MAMGNELYGKLRGHLGPRKLRPDRAAAEPSHARGRLPGELQCGLLLPEPAIVRRQRARAHGGGL